MPPLVHVRTEYKRLQCGVSPEGRAEAPLRMRDVEVEVQGVLGKPALQLRYC